jgi:hypothetical protein
MYILNSDF